MSIEQADQKTERDACWEDGRIVAIRFVLEIY